MTTTEVWVLTVYDLTTGMATHPVGVFGSNDEEWAVSWVPHTSDRNEWALDDRDLPAVEATRRALSTDGITRGQIALAPMDAPDVRGAVESAYDTIFPRGG